MADDPTPRRGLLPSTLRLIVLVLGAIVLACICAIVALVVYGAEVPDGLITIAAGAAGAIGVMAANSSKGD